MICPTITVDNLDDYRSQLELAKSLAGRIHIDLMDGVFAPRTSPNIEDIWLPNNVISDLHLMYMDPFKELEIIKKLHPDLVIIHSESRIDHLHFVSLLHSENIKVGLAILPQTSLDQVAGIITSFDYVMIFSGNLGYQGGSQVDLSLVDRVEQVKSRHPSAEIGWDGGVNSENVATIARAGVDVINVGGFIHNAQNPQEAYAKLEVVARRSYEETKH